MIWIILIHTEWFTINLCPINSFPSILTAPLPFFKFEWILNSFKLLILTFLKQKVNLNRK